MAQLAAFWAKLTMLVSTIRFSDIVDILIVAYLIYNVIMLIRKTNSYRLAQGVLLILIAIFAPLIAPCDPNLQDYTAILQAPSKLHLLGTDEYGRDILSRIIYGTRVSLSVGILAQVIATIIGVTMGSLAAYYGGWVDMLLMRITEIFSSLPFLPFAMMLSYVIRTMPIGENTRIFIIMIILGLLSWTGLARMIRAQVLAEREKEFVIAAKSMGVKENRIAFKHILPNVISIILVNITLDFAGCMLTESSLSYLGFGVQQPQPTWGNMLNGANNSIVIQNFWWQWLFPAIALSVATISINIIGDTLRDVLDPKSSQEK